MQTEPRNRIHRKINLKGILLEIISEKAANGDIAAQVIYAAHQGMSRKEIARKYNITLRLINSIRYRFYRDNIDNIDLAYNKMDDFTSEEFLDFIRKYVDRKENKEINITKLKNLLIENGIVNTVSLTTLRRILVQQFDYTPKFNIPRSY